MAKLQGDDRGPEQGRSQGRRKGGSPPPKKVLKKMMLFPKALFLVTNFPKIVKNSICLLNFHQKFSDNAFFVQTREKLTHGLLTFWKNMLK